MPRKVYVTDPKLFEKPKVKEETKEEEAARIAKRQLAVGEKVKTLTSKEFIVDAKIGSGGMGEVYRVHSARDPELKFAMKTEGNDAADKSLLRLKCEAFVYGKIAKDKDIDKSHYVRMIDTGRADNCKFFIMDLIWQPLHIVVGDILNWQLSAHTKVSIARQTLKGIEGLHTIGFLHRDIKPSNFAVGLPPHEKIVYTLDFGIARDYIDKDTNSIRVEREKVIFMGTLPYASIAGLLEREQGRREDLESWLYMMMEIYDRKNLKWRRLDWNQLSECIRLRKDLFKNAKTGVLNLKLPHAYYDIIYIIDGMRYYLKNDGRLTAEIDKIGRILDRFVREERIDMSLPLDWVKVCFGDEKRRKDRDEKEGEGRKDEKRTSKDSKKKEKRREERDEADAKIPDSGTARKKKRSKSKSKDKRRRHQTQTEDDYSTRSDSDTGHSESTYQLFKQWRHDYRKEHGKKPGEKKKRSKEGMVTAKDRDVKEKKDEGLSLDDKAVSGPDLVKETRKDKKDKTIDVEAEVDEKKEIKKEKEGKDSGKSRFGLPKNAVPIKIDEKTEVDEKKNERTKEKVSKTGEQTEVDEKKNERKMEKEKEDKGDDNKGKEKTEVDEKKEERKKEDKGDGNNKKSSMGVPAEAV